MKISSETVIQNTFKGIRELGSGMESKGIRESKGVGVGVDIFKSELSRLKFVDSAALCRAVHFLTPRSEPIYCSTLICRILLTSDKRADLAIAALALFSKVSVR